MTRPAITPPHMNPLNTAPTITMRRLPDWPERLAAHLHAARARPFCWGTHDCCTFAADAVHAITGWDYMASLRARYFSGLQAARVLREGGGLRQMVSDRMGPMVRATHATRGDVVVFDTQRNGEALGICVGAQFAAPAAWGLCLFDMNVALAAWKVPA